MSGEQRTGARPKILIVDDSRVVRVSMNKILGGEYEVIEAVDGEDGWAQIRANEDLRCVFTDYSMPELDGFGLLDRIRGSANTRINRLPVILVTGNEDDSGVRQEARKVGFNGVVMKPFKPGEIRECLRHVLPEPKTAAEAEAQDRPAAGGGLDEAALLAMRQEIERLKTQTASFLARAEQAEKARLEAEQELTRVRAELEVARLEAASFGKTAEDSRKLQEDLAQLQSQFDAAINRAELAEAAHRKAEQEISSLQEELRRHQHDTAEQIQHREQQYQEVQDQLAAARGRIEELDLARKKAENEIKQLRTELMLRQKGAEEAQSEQVEQLRQEIAALHDELGKAHEATEAARKIRKELEREMERLQAENQAMQERLQAESEEHERTRRMVERLRQDREAAIARAESSEDRLERAEILLKKLKSELGRTREQDQELLKVREELVAVRAELDALRIDKEAAEAAQREAENELVSLAASLEAMEKAKDALEAKVIELQAELNDRREQELRAKGERQPRPDDPDNDSDSLDEAVDMSDPPPVRGRHATAEVRQEPELGEVIELAGFWPGEQDPLMGEEGGERPAREARRPAASEVRRENAGSSGTAARGKRSGLAAVLVTLLLVGGGAGALAWYLGLFSDTPDTSASRVSSPESAASPAERVRATPKASGVQAAIPEGKGESPGPEKAGAVSAAVSSSPREASRKVIPQDEMPRNADSGRSAEVGVPEASPVPPAGQQVVTSSGTEPSDGAVSGSSGLEAGDAPSSSSERSSPPPPVARGVVERVPEEVGRESSAVVETTGEITPVPVETPVGEIGKEISGQPDAGGRYAARRAELLRAARAELKALLERHPDGRVPLGSEP